MKKVIIIGGGFAGTTIAKALEESYKVTLIDSKNFFEFTPGILRTLVEPQHRKKIQSKYQKFLRKTEVINECVTKINNTTVLVKKKKIPYDYLVLATGSRYNKPIKGEVLSSVNRANELIRYTERVNKAKSIVIIGGGIVGVELAAEIIDHFPEKKITLIHGPERVMQRNKEKTSAYAQSFFEKRNVTLHLNKRANIVSNKVILPDGTTLKPDLIFFCTGITPNGEITKTIGDVIDEKGYVKVNKYLQVKGHKNIFAVGDVNDIKIEKTAQNAEDQAKIIIKNIKHQVAQQKLKPYQKTKTSLIISLGKRRGILETKWFVLTGWIPAVLKTFVEKKEMRKRK